MWKKVLICMLLMSLASPSAVAWAAEIGSIDEQAVGTETEAEINLSSSVALHQDNLSFQFNGIEGETLSSTANGKPKILVFFMTTCWNCRATLNDFDNSSWIRKDAVDVYAIEISQKSLSEVVSFKDAYCSEYIEVAYAEDSSASSAMWQYMRQTGSSVSSVTTPVILMVDGNNKIRFCTTGLLDEKAVNDEYLPVLIPGWGTEEQPSAGENWPFTDVAVSPGSWKYDSVKYVYENNIMNGITKPDGTINTFEPDSSLTRGMFATVLYRMAGSPSVTYVPEFSDVPKGQYYSDAVIWARQKEIVKGYDDGSFGVSDYITREQIAKMLMEYARVQGYQISDRADLGFFPDQNKVSGWAADYMRWAVGVGMINGKNINGTYYLDPQGKATRAECAAMLTRFLQKYQ